MHRVVIHPFVSEIRGVSDRCRSNVAARARTGELFVGQCSTIFLLHPGRIIWLHFGVNTRAVHVHYLLLARPREAETIGALYHIIAVRKSLRASIRAVLSSHASRRAGFGFMRLEVPLVRAVEIDARSACKFQDADAHPTSNGYPRL
jgi:hypothetical protein